MEKLLTEGKKVSFDIFGGPEQDLKKLQDRLEDEQLVKRARKFFWDNCFCVMGSMLFGLLFTMYHYPVVRTLVATKRTSSASGAFSRFLNTIEHVALWFGEDRGARRTSLGQVRKLHTLANRDPCQANKCQLKEENFSKSS